MTDGQVAELRERLSLPEKHVAIYSGGLYPTKRIPFLLESAVAIRELVPDFQLLVMGDGPVRDVVREAADRFPWIHFLGPKNDEEKVPYWSVADILLMPGGVGLAILDSFALEVPIVTTDTKLHGPEISYLESGRNGLLVTCGEYVHHFASEAAALLDDPARLTLMKSACASSASTHTIEKMVANFAVGVRRCLGEP